MAFRYEVIEISDNKFGIFDNKNNGFIEENDGYWMSEDPIEAFLKMSDFDNGEKWFPAKEQ